MMAECADEQYLDQIDNAKPGKKRGRKPKEASIVVSDPKPEVEVPEKVS